MKNNTFDLAGWMARLMLVVCLVVFMSGLAVAGTISGSVTNNTTRVGRVFMYLQQQNGGDTGLGVSIPTPVSNTPFSIRGVPNGSYTLKAFVDGSGTGRLHARDPIWNSSGTIDINNNNYSGTNSTVTFTSVPNVSLQQPGRAMIIPGDNGAFVGWDEPTDTNGNTIADSYRVYYSTTSTTPYPSASYITVPAGDQAFALFHYPNGTTLNIQVTALVGTTESGPTAVATTVINPPSPSGFSISGTINMPTIINPTGNLYVALVNRAGKGGPVAVAWVANSPQLSGNHFTINTNSTNAPPGTYSLYAFIDMNSNGKMDSGDVMPSEQQAPTVTVSGTNITVGTPITLTKTNSSPFLNTTHWQDTNTPPNESYQITIGAKSKIETLTNITITNGPGTNGLTYPIDLCINSWGEFQSWFNVNNNRPQLTDVYNLNIQYANGAVGPDTVNLPVTAVLDSFATPTAPVGNLPYSAMTTPSIYSWTAPASPPTSYTYSFWTSANGFNNNNNEYNDMSSATTFLSFPGLSYDYELQYNWNINVQDSFGNQAQKSAWFVYTNRPAITSFTPTTALPGMTVTINGSNFNPTPANNTVYFGCGWSAQATTASATQLQVVVPQNACTGSIQVYANGQPSNNSSIQLTIPWMNTINGQVSVSGTYNGIPGATVTVNSALVTKSTLTDPYGNYNLSGVPSGMDFTLKFTATGYEPAYTGTLNTNFSGTYQNMALFPAGTFTAWNSGNLTTGVIHGRVFEQSNGSGITGVAISASAGTVMYDDGSGNTPVAGSATGANGVFYIKLVPDSASVTINATKAGYLINPVTAVGHALGITSVDLTGIPLISVSGTIVNSSNAPLAGAEIELVGTSNNVTSVAGGAFTINNIPGGTSFELKMSLDPTYMPVYSGWINTSTSLTLPYPYVLFTPAEFSVGLGIASGKGAIVGRVVNSNNPAAAISGATVTANGQSPNYTVRYYDSGTGLFSSTTSTDASGLFLVRDVEDGANISVNASVGTSINGNMFVTAHAYAVTEIAVPCYVPGPSWGNLQSPGSVTVMTTQTTPDIYGRVYLSGITDIAPGPAPGLVAELGYGPQGSAPSSPSWVWKTAAYGSRIGIYYEYATNLSVTTAGSYDYVYRYSYFGGQYSYGDLNGPAYGLPYYPGKLTVTAPTVSVNGKVLISNGAAVEGATVTVVGNPTLTATTSGDGSYTINGIQVGQDFQVRASMVGYVDAYSATFRSNGGNVNARELVLLAPAEVNGISPTTGGISGQTIISGLGIALDGATVSIVSSSGSYTVLYDNGSGTFLPGGTTGATGRFFIPNIADGDTVVLSASRPGWNLLGQKKYLVHANAVTQGSLSGTYSTTTTVTMTGGSNPSYYGDALTFTASVSPSSASGTVQFKVDGVNFGTPVTLVGGLASSGAISSMTVAAHSVTAVFSGLGYAASTSAPLQQTVSDRVKIGSIGNFLTLQTAINAAVNTNVLLLRDTRFAEDLMVNRTLPFTITLKGGLASNFSTPAATATSVRSFKIRLGKVIVNRLVVKPD